MLPTNIRVRAHGNLPHQQVIPTLSAYDLFFLPTLGENYCYVILEALVAGCPVLISDQTPWRNLPELGVGWDLPLQQPQLFRDALQRCVDMGAAEFQEYSERAHGYGIMRSNDPDLVDQHRAFFLRHLRRN